MVAGPYRLCQWGISMSDKASTLHAQLAEATRLIHAMGDRLADLQTENNQLRGYLDSATAMLMIERNAQAGHRPRPS